MSVCDQLGLLPVDVALAKQSSCIKNATDSEQVGLQQGLGRILAADIQASIDLPLADNSAMDGYAFRWTSQAYQQAHKVVANVLAGHPYAGEISSGECVRITTGGLLPTGADTVVMQEHVNPSAAAEIPAHAGDSHSTTTAQVVWQTPVKRGQNVRKRGEDITAGTAVVTRGTRLNARHLALIASVGIAQIPVYRKITVGVLATGDELKIVGEALSAGQIYECNRIGLIAMLKRLQVQVIDYGILPDDYQAIKTTLITADRECDWIISSGGVSVGTADLIRTIIAEIGQVEFWKVAIKPGKPYAFGRLSKSFLSGLPGNPVSSFVTFLQLVVPGLRQLAGESNTQRAILLPALAAEAIHKHPARADYQRGVYYTDSAGQLHVATMPKQGSNILTSLSSANCFIVLEQGRGKIQAGETVNVLPFDMLLN